MRFAKNENFHLRFPRIYLFKEWVLTMQPTRMGLKRWISYCIRLD